MGVEQVAAGERDPQNRLDDVADGAVIGQSNLLCRVHEVTAAKRIFFKIRIRSERVFLFLCVAFFR